jgi:hypothetical protein
MDDVNISIEEVVLDGASPLSQEHLQAVLSRQADDAQIPQLPDVTRAIGESLCTRLSSELW